MLNMGIIEPAKITGSALQHACAIAGLMLSTEVMLADAPEEEKMPAVSNAGHCA